MGEEAQVADNVEGIALGEVKELWSRQIFQIRKRQRQIQGHVTVVDLVLMKKVCERNGDEPVVWRRIYLWKHGGLTRSMIILCGASVMACVTFADDTRGAKLCWCWV